VTGPTGSSPGRGSLLETGPGRLADLRTNWLVIWTCLTEAKIAPAMGGGGFFLSCLGVAQVSKGRDEHLFASEISAEVTHIKP